ncbi:MAG: insulinase family protein [Oscillospiraceae bacterium]|nr:insulinase family protein [Oscillospiraceae bacterium]
MQMNDIVSERLGEKYISVTHGSGLKMKLYPMQGFTSAYALFSTEYGSTDVCFKTNNDSEFIEIPEGTAHFLEHKLFESEDGDAFSRYAETGASANAYTSFDRTAYLFSCTDNFEESLEILLDFVTKPYFTEQTVQKEQGIIGQEIKMYDDSPDWRVMLNLLSAMYKNSSVKVDIAGTAESIAKINADMLYRCYRTFYNLSNMVLTVAGNFEPETVLKVADRVLKKNENIVIESKIPDEPDEVNQNYICQNLPVSAPLFEIGFKGISKGKSENYKMSVIDEMVQEIIIGESSELYAKLYNEGLIDSEFDKETFSGRDYIMMLFSGESKEPEKVYDEIKNAVKNAAENGVDKERFEICRKVMYGRYLRMLDKPDNIANLLLSSYFANSDPFEIIDLIAKTNIEELNDRIKNVYDSGRSALSVIKAK